VPDIFLGGKAPSSAIDRCHSLSSLSPLPAAVASLPVLDDGRAAQYVVNKGQHFFTKSSQKGTPLF
jgi:hypothetical protein